MADLKNLSTEIAAADQEVQDKLTTIKGTSGDGVSTADMFELQQKMIHLDQLAEMSSSVVSAANSAILGMAKNVK